MGELQRTTAETETNFQCGNFESWKKDQIMIHILCLTRHTYEKTLFVKICNAQSTFFPNLETFIFNNSFLKVKGPSRSFLKRWEYQIILPVSWETCMQVKKQVKTLHGRTDWFKIGKGIPQGCILSPSLFNLYAEYIKQMLGRMKHKLESRLPGEKSVTSDIQMTPPLWQKVKRN